MARIFLILAGVSVALLAFNFVLGLGIVDFNPSARRLVAAREELKHVEHDSTATPTQRQQALEAAQTAADSFAPVRTRATRHFILGVTASLVVLLVNSISITYFVGTSRWCKEVVATYQLDEQLARRSQSLKRRTFPWALAGMLTMVCIAALGASSDPSANFESSAQWAPRHFLGSIIGAALIAFSYVVQARNITANYTVIEEVMQAVRGLRGE